MDFFRGDAYSEYFDFLDKSGGYYYEVRFLTCFLISPA